MMKDKIALSHIRKALVQYATNNRMAFEKCLNSLQDDPLEYCKVYISLLEYCVPKLSRTELTGDDGNQLTIKIIRDDGRGDAQTAEATPGTGTDTTDSPQV
jgi:hypothetical protein